MKWLLLAVVVVAAVLFGFGKYVADHATDEGSFFSEGYGPALEASLLKDCNANVSKLRRPGSKNTPAQYASTCKCFANDMSEKLRTVPPRELQAYFEKDATKTSMQRIMKKCGQAAGLD